MAIIGHSSRSSGSGSSPVIYLLDPNRSGRENAPPELLRGNAELTVDLINSLDFKHTYTSGVISFAHGEEITKEMEEYMMDRHEKVAFAGLEQDQYNILWVRHTHAGHHELHYVTPRVELSTGKSLNIKPPGKLSQDTFDDLRSEFNARYGLADPDDPDRKRDIAVPDHLLKLRAEALRNGSEVNLNERELVHEILVNRAENGLIRSRNDVLDQVKELGFDVKREGKNYITLQDRETNKRFRMKGGMYEREFKVSRAIEAAEKPRVRDYSKPDEAAYKRYAARVDRHIERRAEYNTERYRVKNQNDKINLAQQNNLAINNSDMSLSGYLGRQLRDDAILDERDSVHARREETNNEQPRSVEAARYKQVEAEPLRRKAVRQDRRKSTKIRSRLANSGGEINDRARKPSSRDVEEFKQKMERSIRSFNASTERIKDDVRSYNEREWRDKRREPSTQKRSAELRKGVESLARFNEALAKSQRTHALKRGRGRGYGR